MRRASTRRSALDRSAARRDRRVRRTRRDRGVGGTAPPRASPPDVVASDHPPSDYPPAGMSAKREKCPWKPTVMVPVGPLRCLATMKSASPARGLSFS